METLEADDPRQVGPYQLAGKIRTFSAGEVFAARSADGRSLEVTVVRPEVAAAPGFRERFRAGVAAARAVPGPFVMPVVDADPEAPSPWTATAVVRGLPLRQAVERFGRLPESTLRGIALGLGRALSRIHAARLVHGGVRPDSVLLAGDGPYLAAFDPTGSVDADGSPMGDLLDLGATMLFTASGGEWWWDSLSEDAQLRIAELETVMGGLPPSLREVIGGCFYPDPSTRPTAQQLVDYLDRQGLPAPAEGWLPPALSAEIAALDAAAPSVSRRKLLLGLVGGVLMIGGGTAAAVLSSNGSSPTPSLKPAPPSPSSSATASASASASSTGGPTQITLDAPDATKEWQVNGQSAPTCLEASDKVVMVMTDKTTAFVDASTGKPMLPALNTTSGFGGDNMTSRTTYAGGVFYYLCDVPGSPNMIAAVDGTTGSVKWATRMAGTNSNGDFRAARYVAVNGTTVFVCGSVVNSASVNLDTTTGYIRAFDAATGNGLWTVEGTDINNVLVPQSGSALLAASSTPGGKAGQVEMIDSGNQGARGWKLPSFGGYYFTTGWPMTCFAAGLFCFVGGSGSVVIAVDAATGQEKWRQEFDAKNGDQVELGDLFASPDGQTVYVPVGRDLASLNSADGTVKWVATVTGAGAMGGGNLFEAGLGVVGRSARCSADTVFVTDAAQTLWAIDAATGKARWKYRDPGQPDTGFKWTVGGDRVFIASNLTLTAISAHGQ
ncbi:PQQ-binding-like beta-propeller repeat protein [Streptomyces sp. CBMA123]|uniref:outer membrane protein assembly factor BamB family protein n=1 Tax=Streptomyces sp. CBMA123 TaxID=1896313 RepID=UPI001661C9A0|nr:PQQ-binding-like beta-propeller repeat protein [Streptomyces sp. CBMA123]MBD0694050.1 hypothetical protein [Streptomyces sp. CBMA123]